MVVDTVRPTPGSADALITEFGAALLGVFHQLGDDVGVLVDNVVRLARIAAHVVEPKLGRDSLSVAGAGLVSQVELPISSAHSLNSPM